MIIWKQGQIHPAHASCARLGHIRLDQVFAWMEYTREQSGLPEHIWSAEEILSILYSSTCFVSTKNIVRLLVIAELQLRINLVMDVHHMKAMLDR
jgi:hypothetical protein